MIKRPLLWALIGFVLGEVLTFFNNVTVAFIIAFLLILIFIAIIFLRHINRYNQYDNLILFMPVIVYAGFLLMNIQQSIPLYDAFFDEKTSASVEGVIYKLADKEDRYTIYLKDCIIKFDNFGNDSEYISNKIIAYSSKDTHLRTGNIISIKGKLEKFQKPRNKGQFDEFTYYKMQGIDYKFHVSSINITDEYYKIFNEILKNIKVKLINSYNGILNNKDAGIISAMVLGDKGTLDLDIKELYQKNGISHILAISGLHIALIGMALFGLLKRIGLNITISGVISIFIIFYYGELTGFSISTNRAVVMLIITLSAKMLGRTYDMLSAISLSGLIILVPQPMQIYNAGFLLSFGAVLGIGILVPVFKEIITIRNVISDGLIVSFSVNIITLPVILYFYFEFPVYSLILNLLIIPLMSLLMPLALIGGIVGCFSLALGTFIIGGVHYILELYEIICNVFVKLPSSNIIIGRPELWQIFLYYIVIALFVALYKYIGQKSLLTLVFALVLFIKLPSAPLELTFIDVGQGDGIFFKTKWGTTYLVDGGSTQVSEVGRYRIIPFLKSNRVCKLDYIIVTHLHEDHISGIKEIIQLMDVGILILPVTNLIGEPYLGLIDMAENKGIVVKFIKKGDAIYDGNLVIRCLHPYEGFIAHGENEYSTVLSLEMGEFKALLTGDLEAEQERLIKPMLNNYFLLKVGHHGSKTSSSGEFLNIVMPYVSIISSGKNNVYKHPSKEVTDRLSNLGSLIINTQDNGAVTVRTNGDKIDINTYLSKRNIQVK